MPVIMNTALAQMKAGQAALGLSLGLGTAATALALSQSGADFVLLDRQHGIWDESEIGRAIGEIRLGAAMPMARVARNDYASIGQLLDKGMLGIVVPMVNTPEQAQAVVDACLLPPRGQRSWGWNLAQRYGPDYAARINDELFVCVQIESAVAVRNAEAILGTPGISGCWCGPSDLALSLGFLPQAMNDRDEHKAALDAVRAACRATGKIPGIACSSLADARQRFDQGFRFLTVSSDLGLLAASARHAIAEMQTHMADRA